MPRSGPTRTCCGCGDGDRRDDLVRLALGLEGQLIVDLRGRMPGRGAWVHPRAACVDALEHRPGALRRSLREMPTTDGLKTAVVQAVSSAAQDGLSMAAAAGALVSGRDRLTRALRDGKVEMVVVAHDASERTVDEYRGAARTGIDVVMLPLDTAALGARVGKGPRAALGVRPISASTHLLRQLRRLRDLG